MFLLNWFSILNILHHHNWAPWLFSCSTSRFTKYRIQDGKIAGRRREFLPSPPQLLQTDPENALDQILNGKVNQKFQWAIFSAQVSRVGQRDPQHSNLKRGYTLGLEEVFDTGSVVSHHTVPSHRFREMEEVPMFKGGSAGGKVVLVTTLYTERRANSEASKGMVWTTRVEEGLRFTI